MTELVPTSNLLDVGLQEMLTSVFQRPNVGSGTVVGFTAANPGEGVSYVSKKLAHELVATRCDSVAHLKSTQLIGETVAGEPVSGDVFAHHGRISSLDTWEELQGTMHELRSRYRYAIVDCPSISARGDILRLAPHLDGIVVVVAANKTRKTQISNVQREIQMVNGNLLGFVLNKRKYFVPDWLHKLL